MKTIFLIVYFFFLLSGFTVKKLPSYFRIYIFIMLNLYSILCSFFAQSIDFLHLIVAFQISTYFIAIIFLKSLTKDTFFYAGLAIVSFFSFVSITRSFGHYYLKSGVINLPHIDFHQIHGFSKLGKIMSTEKEIFLNSRKYYDSPSSDPVQHLQNQIYTIFIIGIMINVLISFFIDKISQKDQPKQ